MNVLLFTITLPSAVRGWNNIPNEHRNIHSVMTFKNVLGPDKPLVPSHYLFENVLGPDKPLVPSHYLFGNR